jgi:hypothetical protein
MSKAQIIRTRVGNDIGVAFSLIVFVTQILHAVERDTLRDPSVQFFLRLAKVFSVSAIQARHD